MGTLPFPLLFQRRKTRVHAFLMGFSFHPAESHLSRQTLQWIWTPQVLHKAPHLERDLSLWKLRSMARYDISTDPCRMYPTERVFARVSLCIYDEALFEREPSTYRVDGTT